MNPPPAVGERRDPDPSTLTTAALLREIGSLKEIIFVRLDAMDKAQEVFSENLNRVPTATDRAVAQLKELIFSRMDTVEQQFQGIEQRFRDRDARAADAKEAADKALLTALASAKDAVQEANKNFSENINKSERSIGEQIALQRQLLEQATTALGGQIGDLRVRLTRVEALAQAAATNATAGRQDQSLRQGSSSYVVAIVGLVTGALIGAAGLILALTQ